MIKEKKEEIRQKDLKLRKWTEENDNDIENICDLYFEL